VSLLYTLVLYIKTIGDDIIKRLKDKYKSMDKEINRPEMQMVKVELGTHNIYIGVRANGVHAVDVVDKEKGQSRTIKFADRIIGNPDEIFLDDYESYNTKQKNYWNLTKWR
jgi:hypothetical protein